MGESLVINVLVYTNNGGSPVTSSIGLEPMFLIHLITLLVVLQLTIYGFTYLVSHTQDIVYTLMGGLPTINVMVHVLFVGSPPLKVKPFAMVFIG